MAARKKKKSRNRKKKVNLSKLNSTQLRNTGKQLIGIGKYADAIPYCREFAVRQPGEEANRLLVQAYQQRIKELVEKGMFSEAIAIMRSMENTCKVSLEPIQQISLLCQCHKYSEAVTVYQDNIESLTSSAKAVLDEFFAAVLLSGDKECLELLPEESLIISHYPLAQTLLGTFLSGDPDQASRALKKIPFRSPYRNFRLLIGGLLQLENDPTQADTILQKIPKNSPYYPLIDIFSSQGLDAKGKVDRLVAARETAGFDSLLTAARLNQEQGKFLSELLNTGRTDYEKILSLLFEYAECFPAQELKEIVSGLFIQCPDPDHRIVKKSTAGYSKKDLSRLYALFYEVDHQPLEAVEEWDDYLDRLPKNTPDYALRKALVLRKQVELTLQEEPPPWTQEGLTKDRVLFRLLKSIELDPDDREVWLQIIETSQVQGSSLKTYRLIDRALEQFPDDIEFLLKAIEASEKRDAFKKAARFANRLLKIDPINTRCKELLANAHFSHGYKLCRQKKYHLAIKEFDAVDSDIRSRTLAGRSIIAHAMLAYVQKQKEKGDALLAESKTYVSSPFMGTLLSAMEVRRMGLPKMRIKDFDKTLRGTSQAADIDLDEFYDIILWQQNSQKEEGKFLKECFLSMKKYFNKALDRSWPPKKARDLAEALAAAELYPQLKKIASSQLAAGTEEDYKFFKYMLIVAQTGNGRKNVTESIIYSLDEIMGIAMFGGDPVLLERVEILYNKCRTNCHANSGVQIDDSEEEYMKQEFFRMLDRMGGMGNPGSGKPGSAEAQRNMLELLDKLDFDDFDDF